MILLGGDGEEVHTHTLRQLLRLHMFLLLPHQTQVGSIFLDDGPPVCGPTTTSSVLLVRVRKRTQRGYRHHTDTGERRSRGVPRATIILKREREVTATVFAGAHIIPVPWSSLASLTWTLAGSNMQWERSPGEPVAHPGPPLLPNSREEVWFSTRS